jgi:hypothetical protein
VSARPTDADRLAPDPAVATDRGEGLPLAGYSVLSTTFVVAFVGGAVAARRTRGGLPPRYSPWDLFTAGIATHKLSRLLTKDRVASVLRSPFVEGQQRSGHGEVSGEPRGTGLQRAVGELLTCPHCLGQWISAGFGVGMIAAPEVTRLVAFIYSAQAIGDFLQLAYRASADAVDAPPTPDFEQGAELAPPSAGARGN